MDDAMSLYAAGNFTRAILLLEEIDRYKDAPFYCSAKYNLARAYHKADLPLKGKSKYEDYLRSCKESSEDTKTAKTYLNQLIAEHFGAIKIICVDSGLMLKVDQGNLVPCPLDIPHLLAGDHHLSIFSGERLLETRSFKIIVKQETLLQIPAFARLTLKGVEGGGLLVDGLPVPVLSDGALLASGQRAIVVQRPACPDEARSLIFHPGQHQTLALSSCTKSNRTPWPWVVAGSGAAILGLGVVFYAKNQAAADGSDDKDLYYRLTLASYGLGGSLLIGGLSWQFWPTEGGDVAHGLNWQMVW
ncbi:hypothetical protein KKB55_20270 [Myxococcota bacterium]|nr:hypothetical protein [Myxococcota bacterium]MBU1900085.1 hypothetical protein [Myxococcota bacterium]